MDRILVAYDGGEPARRALETAAELATRFGAGISVLSVAPAHPSWLAADRWTGRRTADDRLDEARRILADRGLDAETIEPAGDPASAIERIATLGRFDAVVVGSRGLGTVERLLGRSVSQHVRTHLGSTVIVVR